MGCSSSHTECINYDVLNPPVNSNFKNTRVKTELFPEGEIYYLRNNKELKKDNIPKSNSKGIMAYDGVLVELSVEYKFARPELMHEFKGSVIKVYHSDISLDNEFTFIGSTEEYVDNDLHFKKRFRMYYCFQKLQVVKIEIEINNNIQVVNTSLGNILGSKDLFVELPFFYNERYDECSVIMRGVVVKDENKNSFITLNLITDLSKLPYSDYFVVISNWHHPRRPQKVWKSKETPGTETTFTAQMITMQDLCLGNQDKKITIEFYGIYCGFVGKADKTLRQLTDARDNKEKVPILTEEGEEKGYFYINYNIEKISRFIDLIENGLQIKISFAIDYTNSNKEYKNPKSLHYIGDPDKLNPYEHCLRCFGELVGSYDFEHKIAMFGYGGIIPSTGETSHCFPISLTNSPIAMGIDAAIKQYKDSLPKISLDGPTYFFPIFKENLAMIKDDAECPTSIYHLLVIVTDGTIHDLDEMKRQLIKNETQPISVCIVGVGDENFSKMYQLDCNTKPLEDKNGNKSKRDICQFVRYKDFRDRPDKLTESMLMLIPSQVEAYFRASNNFVGLSDAGKPKNINIRKVKEEEEREKMKQLANRTKSSNKKSSMKLTEKDKYDKNREEEKAFIETNAPQREN